MVSIICFCGEIRTCCVVSFMRSRHVSGVLGREDCIAQLLIESRVAPADICCADQVRLVLRKILASQPRWLCLQTSGASVVSVINPGVNTQLAKTVQEWMPVEVKSCCGKPCVRWRLLPARFVTLASGVLHGQVVCVRPFAEFQF